MGIEPTAQAWEAWVLPLYDAREGWHCNRLLRGWVVACGCRGRGAGVRVAISRRAFVCVIKSYGAANVAGRHKCRLCGFFDGFCVLGEYLFDFLIKLVLSAGRACR